MSFFSASSLAIAAFAAFWRRIFVWLGGVISVTLVDWDAYAVTADCHDAAIGLGLQNFFLIPSTIGWWQPLLVMPALRVRHSDRRRRMGEGAVLRQLKCTENKKPFIAAVYAHCHGVFTSTGLVGSV